MAKKRKIISKNKEAQRKQVDWLALWLQWAEEGLVKKWRLNQITSENALGRMLLWLSMILKNIIVQQVQMNMMERQQEATTTRLAALEAEVKKLAVGK